MSWKGFQDDDDDKHEDGEERGERVENNMKHNLGLGGDKRVNLRAKKNMTRERLLQAAADQKVNEVLDVPPEALLSKPSKPPVKEVKEPTKPSESPTKAAQVKLKIADGKCEVFPSVESPTTATPSFETSNQDCDVPRVELETNKESKDDEDKSDPSSKVPQDKMSKLEIFEVKQKLIEEQNRKRKELLTAAINDRRRQTSQETKKLQYIQEELQKIDNLLTTDVKFLRNSIEQASVDFSEAQKRYDKAEKEFIDAKMNLFRIMERKELLTDHLCSIIEQNEMRKAKKLTELMDKLNIDSSEAVFEKNEEFSLQDLRESAEFNTLKKLDQVENKPDDL